ncbi:MAG: LemA family protein [Nanoarchaeota archaeon]|nr:LemA family protein [Nanoarchaeota archaeon]
MSKSFFEKNKTLIIVSVVVLVILAMIVGMYNNFVTLDQNINGKWSLVENDYQRQADLIPNFVSTVSNQVGVETTFVKDVIGARTAYATAQSQYQKDLAGQQMNSGINAVVNAVAEDYPELLASEGYTALRDELAGSQNRITKSRKDYIDAIQAYNTATKKFPANVFANMFGFVEKEYYEATAELTTPVLGDGVLPQ